MDEIQQSAMPDNTNEGYRDISINNDIIKK
jgi:hypothetical protein